MHDPRPYGEGGTGSDLLILDGERRYIAAGAMAWPLEEFDVLIKPQPTLYHALLETATIQASHRPLTDREAGMLCRRLLVVNTMLRERGVPGVPEVREEDLGHSQATASGWPAPDTSPPDAL